MSKSLFKSTSLSWDAMLNMTKVELELIPDPEMYIFSEEGKRSGVMTQNKNQNILYT